MKLDRYLTAHGFMRVERPPLLWEADTEEVAFLELTGEMIASALGRGNELSDLVLAASNVAVDADAATDKLSIGEFVAITIRGSGDWSPEMVWTPASPRSSNWTCNVERAAPKARAEYAYVRTHREGGSLTVFLRRLL
jgi:hypothetical protein